MSLTFRSRSLALLLTFIFVGTVSAYSDSLVRLTNPISNRLVKVNFFVDNERLLEKPYLEVTVVEDSYSKRMVPLQNNRGNTVGTGVSEISVPDGTVHLTVCGMVRCSAKEETELVCGKTAIPGSIQLHAQHEVTFSTQFACQDGPSLLASR